MDEYWALTACTTVLAGMVVLVTIFRSGRDRTRESLTPEQVLARRFAAGEIDEREYLTRLSILDEARQLSK